MRLPANKGIFAVNQIAFWRQRPQVIAIFIGLAENVFKWLDLKIFPTYNAPPLKR
jgi:hypothetical protein